MLTAERLREVLHYDPLAGVFTWRVTLGPRALAGTTAGKKRKSSPYRTIRIAGKLYKAHRLAYLYMVGAWPPRDIDHHDLDKANNRWVNLRPATRSENNQNQSLTRRSASGSLCIFRRGAKWNVVLTLNGAKHRFGPYLSKEEAERARDEAKKVLHPFVSCDTIQTHCNQKGKDVFSITLEFETLEQAITALATLRNPETAPKPEATKAVKDTPKPGKSATTAAPAAGSQDAAAGPAPAPEKKVQEPSASATADAYEPVGALIKKLAATHRAQVLATLGEFGAANGKELKPAQYESFIEKLTAATSGDLA